MILMIPAKKESGVMEFSQPNELGYSHQGAAGRRRDQEEGRFEAGVFHEPEGFTTR